MLPYVQGSVTLKKGGDARTVTVTGLDQSDFTYLVPTAELLEGRYVSSTDSLSMLLTYNIAFNEEGVQQLNVGQTVILEVSTVEESGEVQSINVEKKSFQIKGIKPNRKK